MDSKTSSFSLADRLTVFQHFREGFQPNGVMEQILVVKEELPGVNLIPLFKQTPDLKELAAHMGSIKNVTPHLVEIVNELILENKEGVEDIIKATFGPFKQRFAGENFKSFANYSFLLSLFAYFTLANGHEVVEEHKGYLCSSTGFVNTDNYFQKQPSKADFKNHIIAICGYI